MSRRRRDDRQVEWNFFSFPVAFGFALGMFIGVILFPAAPAIMFVVSLFLVSFGTAHIISRWLRRRTVDKREQRQEEAERERRALAARQAAAMANEQASPRRRRRRRRRPSGTEA